MKIVFFTENSYCGGLDSFLIYLVDHWPEASDELVLVCNRSHPGLEIIRRRVRRDVRIVDHTIPLQWEFMARIAHVPVLGRLTKVLSPLTKYGFFLLYLVSVRRILAREAPDRLMVVNGGYPGGDTNRAATIAWGALRGRRPPALHNLHNLAIAPRWWERPIETFIDTSVARNTLAFVGVSAACAASLAHRPAFRRGARIEVIHNGIPDFPPVEPTNDLRRALGVPDDAPLCLMLGTYEPRKGHAFLLRAFQQVVAALPAARLVMCGFGTARDMARIHILVEGSGLSRNVTVEGFRNDVPALLRAADVLVVPSQAFESFGLMIVEAMAHRVPVVATAVGGIPEVLAGNRGGICVDPENVAAFADRIVAFLSDAALRRATGEDGFQRYREAFTAARMARDYANLVHADANGRTPTLPCVEAGPTTAVAQGGA